MKISKKSKTNNKKNKSIKTNFSKKTSYKKKLKSSKTRKIKLINTRNENCSKNGMTTCCPHMAVDEKGRYAATNEKTILKYDGKKYELYTCCKMCSVLMNKISKDTRNKFARLYINGFDDKGNMLLQNQYTKKHVQTAKLIKEF